MTNQRTTPAAFDQGGASYYSISIGANASSFDNSVSVFSVTAKGDDECEMRSLLNNLTRDLVDDARQMDAEILSVVRSMAGDVGKYRRERKRALNTVVGEIYSAPRTTAAINCLPELKLIPGFALDLTTVDPDDNATLDIVHVPIS